MTARDPPLPTTTAEAFGRELAIRLSSPLTALLLSLQLAQEKLAATGAEAIQAKEILEDALSAAARVRAIVDHMTLQVAPRDRTAPRDASAAPHGPPRVLVVDGDPTVARLLTRMLQGYDVVTIEGIDGALARIRGGERFELILCDPLLGDTIGADFVAQVALLCPGQAESIVLFGGALSPPEAHALLASSRRKPAKET